MEARKTLLTTDNKLPVPESDAAAHSELLTERIRAAIAASPDQWIDFERYMEMALYEPGLGYYAAGAAKLGQAGDFVTAPELTPLFGRFIARQIQPLLAGLDHPKILELGPGSGALADALLRELGNLGQALDGYWLLEPSPDLAERQTRRLAAWGAQTTWLDRPPAAPFEGVILANEVVDALPVSRFQVVGERPVPFGVGWQDGLTWRRHDGATASVAREQLPPLKDGHIGEWCPRLEAWFAAVTAQLRRGAVIGIDYGLPAASYYHGDHPEGRLVCHYRQRRHADPFCWPGLCDISAWVDFSALARAGARAGLRLAGFTTQGQWLAEGGLAALLQGASPADLAAVKTLLLPGEMGEAFKVMAFSRGLRFELPGRDLRDRL